MLGIAFGVLVFRLHGDGFAFLRVGKSQGAFGRAVNLLAIGKPLVFDFAGVEVIGVCDFGGEGRTDFRLAVNFDFAFLVRLYWRPTWVVFNRQGEALDVGAAVAVVAGDVEGDARLFTEVEMLPVFQFQRTVVGYFKAIVAHFVGVRVARVFVARRQFAHDCAIFAFHDCLLVEADVARCVVGRAFRLHFAALGVVRFLVAFGVGVLDFDFQRLAFVFGGDAVGLVGRTSDINTIALPLIFDAALFQTVRVAYFSSLASRRLWRYR